MAKGLIAKKMGGSAVGMGVFAGQKLEKKCRSWGAKVLFEKISLLIFATRLVRNGNDRNAQMAELVDALVSNTNAFGRAGSTPALGTLIKASSFFEGAFLVL